MRAPPLEAPGRRQKARPLDLPAAPRSPQPECRGLVPLTLWWGVGRSPADGVPRRHSAPARWADALGLLRPRLGRLEAACGVDVYGAAARAEAQRWESAGGADTRAVASVWGKKITLGAS